MPVRGIPFHSAQFHLRPVDILTLSGAPAPSNECPENRGRHRSTRGDRPKKMPDSMGDWIEERAVRIKKNQEQAEDARQAGVHEADTISMKGRDILEQLEAVVRKDVEKWNAHFPDDPRRRIGSVGKLTPSGFVVQKTGYPTATLRAFFDPASKAIQFTVTKVRAIGEGEYSIKGLFHLNLSADGEIYLTNRSGEHFPFLDASRHLLEAVLDT
jgi:hypothetical protein